MGESIRDEMFAYALFGLAAVSIIGGAAYASVALQDRIIGMVNVGDALLLGNDTATIIARITIEDLNLVQGASIEFQTDFIMKRFIITPNWHVSSSDLRVVVSADQQSRSIIIKNVSGVMVDSLILNISLEVTGT